MILIRILWFLYFLSIIGVIIGVIGLIKGDFKLFKIRNRESAFILIIALILCTPIIAYIILALWAIFD